MSKHLETALIAKAVNAVFKYEDKKIAERGKRAVAKPILAQVQLKASVKKAILRPVRVKLPHSFVTDEDDEYSICLFCKNEEKLSIDAYLAKSPMKGLSKVLSLKEVKKLYSISKDKKALLSEYSHFVCDTAVLSKLHKLLGKSFAERTNCPVPISFSNPEKLPDAITKVLSSSYMHIKGKIISIRLGLTSMSEEEVTANAVEGLEFAIAKFKESWKDVHSIHLKTADSPSLPIYSKVPSEVLKYVKMKANIVTEENFVGKAKSSKKRGVRKNKITNSNESSDLTVDSTISGMKRGRMTEAEVAAAVVSGEDRPKGIKRIKSSVVKRS